MSIYKHSDFIILECYGGHNVVILALGRKEISFFNKIFEHQSQCEDVNLKCFHIVIISIVGEYFSAKSNNLITTSLQDQIRG